MENKRAVVFGFPNIGEHFIKLMYYNCNGSTEEIECERAFRYYPKGVRILTFVHLQKKPQLKKENPCGIIIMRTSQTTGSNVDN